MPQSRRRPPHKQFLWDLLEDEASPRKKAVDFVIAGLIILSVGTFLYVLSTPAKDHPIIAPLEWAVVAVFAVEYALRFYIANDFIADVRAVLRRPAGSFGRRLAGGLAKAIGAKVRFVLEPIHIIDLLSILPALRVFRVARLFRLVRLLHIVSYRSSLASVIDVFRDHAYELITVFAFVIVVLTVAGTGMFLIEHENPQFQNLGDTFWWAIVTMTTVGYGDKYPITVTGRVLAGLTMMAGICVIALPTAVVTSALMDKVNRLKEGSLKMQNLSGHIVVCGLSRATDIMVAEIRRVDALHHTDTDIVVIAAFAQREAPAGTLLKRGDFTRENVLREAGAERASTILVLAERRLPDVPDETIDARTLLATLVAESLNPGARIMAEVLVPETSSIFAKRLPSVEVIESSALAPRIMASSAVHPGTGEIIKELLLMSEGNDFYEMVETGELIAVAPRFGDLFKRFRARDAIPLSVRRGRQVFTNPPDDFALESGDVIVYIARQKVDSL